MAGKITGPGNGPPGSTPVGGAGTDESRPVAEKGSAFADKLKATGAPPAAATTDAVATPNRAATADLAAALKAGQITPKAAVDRVIDRIIDRQIGANAPTAVREKLRTALEIAVADDPLLADKIRGLG